MEPHSADLARASSLQIFSVSVSILMQNALAAAACFFGRQTREPRPVSVPFHQLYEPIELAVFGDCPMKCLCMVFFEKLCAAEGNWSIWTQRFSENPDDPYARAYRRALAK